MRVERLRPLPSPEQLAAMYATPHDHRLWGQGHHDRVEATIALAIETLSETERATVADLSCGNAEIALRIHAGVPGTLLLGDVAVLPAELPDPKWCGPIEETIASCAFYARTFVCSETIEHLDDPERVLAAIGEMADNLVLSTPIEAWGDENPEHLWAWDREYVEHIVTCAGWTVEAAQVLPTEGYTYLIVVAS